MKRMIILLSLGILLSISCSEKESIPFPVSKISFTPCRQEILKSSELSDKVDVAFTDEGVQVSYYNFEVTCDFTDVSVTHTFENGVLNITQQGSPDQANCICYTDVSYTIEGIIQNEVNVIFINGVQVYCYNDTPCEFENPLVDLPWLKEIVDNNNQGIYMNIFQCTYNNGIIGFFIEPCVNCHDYVASLYSCDGTVLCNIQGIQNIEIYYDEWIIKGEKLIWTNTTDYINGVIVGYTKCNIDSKDVIGLFIITEKKDSLLSFNVDLSAINIDSGLLYHYGAHNLDGGSISFGYKIATGNEIGQNFLCPQNAMLPGFSGGPADLYTQIIITDIKRGQYEDN